MTVIKRFLKLCIAGLAVLAVGFLLGWSAKPTTQYVDRSWEFFPSFNFNSVLTSFSSNTTSVEALRPSCPYSKGHRSRIFCGVGCHHRIPDGALIVSVSSQ